MPLMERLEHEEELLGLFVSGHPLDEYEDTLSRVPHRKIAELHRSTHADLPAGTVVTVAGLVASVNHKTTRSGKGIAFVQLEDATGKLECPVFTEVYAQHKEKLERKNLLKITGKVGYKQAFQADDDAPPMPQVIVDNIELLKHEEKPPVALVLEITPFVSEEELNDLLGELARHPGAGQVVLQVVSDGPLRRVRLPREQVSVALSQDTRKTLLAKHLCSAVYFE